MPIERVVVCKAAALGDKQTVKFAFGRGKHAKEGFVIALAGRLYAYRNECRHIPMTMDWVDNRFLSRDRRFLQCATHGALYEIATGLCVAGPPAGEHLHSLPVAVEDGEVVVTISQHEQAGAGAGSRRAFIGADED